MQGLAHGSPWLQTLNCNSLLIPSLLEKYQVVNFFRSKIYKEIYYIYHKELAHGIMEAGEYKICSVGQPTGDPGELIVQMKSEGSLLDNSQVGKIKFIGSFRFFYGCI